MSIDVNLLKTLTPHQIQKASHYLEDILNKHSLDVSSVEKEKIISCSFLLQRKELPGKSNLELRDLKRKIENVVRECCLDSVSYLDTIKNIDIEEEKDKSEEDDNDSHLSQHWLVPYERNGTAFH